MTLLDTTLERQITNRIDTRRARVVVIGIGYVGLPLAIEFAKAGFRVSGLDTSVERVASINACKSYISDISSEELRGVMQSAHGKLSATTDYQVIEEADAIIITVPTPLNKSRHPDLSHVVESVGEVAQRIQPGTLVVLQSTTYPGTTHEVVAPMLMNVWGGTARLGEDVFVAFAPERIDPGRANWTLKNTPKVIGGETPACLRVATQLFKTIVDTVVPVDSPGEAEMVKLLENTFRATNIALVNEVAIMCDKLGLNVWNVIEAASTKPFGFMKFTPGPGIGGHCIPIDPQYLAWKLRSLNYEARFVSLAEEVNLGMQDYVVDKISLGLNDVCKSIRGSRILCLGVAYKPDVPDLRDSPAIPIMEKLAQRGADLAFHDSYVQAVEAGNLQMRSISLTDDELKRSDCVVILTAHSDYDWQSIVRRSSLIVDTRNATGHIDRKGCQVISI